MSFWFFGEKQGKRRALYSINVPFLVVLIAVAVVVALLLPLVDFVRKLF
jgi:hypothetical protein